MRTVMSGIGVLASLVIVLASMAMNYEFLSSLGKSPFERQIFGALSVAFDALKVAMPFFIAWAWATRRMLFCVFGSAFFGLLLVFALASALGFTAANRGAVSYGQESLNDRLTLAERELGETEGKLKAMPATKPAGVVQEGLKGFQQDKRFISSKSCEDATITASIAFCRDYFALRGELAGAVEAERLAGRQTELRKEIDKLKAAGAGGEVDAQAGFLAKLSGQGEADIKTGLTVLIAVLVELGAAFGPYFSLHHSAPRRAAGEPAETARPVQVAPVRREPAKVVEAVAEIIPPAPPAQAALPPPRRVRMAGRG